MKEPSRSTRGRKVRGLFVIVYLLAQVAVPIGALVSAHRADAPVRFGWQMFSRIPVAANE